ncbi:hypothetical protein [Nostoc sp.]|uniref:hypothetical protein n=1 Tax=Nostoc sp. TaxID=1180 RepID=UPI002FFC0E30
MTVETEENSHRQLLTQRCRRTRAANSQPWVIATLGDATRTPQLVSAEFPTLYHLR